MSVVKHRLRVSMVILIVIILLFGLILMVNDMNVSTQTETLPAITAPHQMLFNSDPVSEEKPRPVPLPAITAPELSSKQSSDETSLPIINVTTYDFSKLFVYGDKQYCNKYQPDGRNISYKYKFKSAMVGGLYNTGTNALLTLLEENCYGLSGKLLINSKKYYKKLRKNISRNVKYFQRFNFKSLYNITKHEAVPAMEQLVEKNIPYDSDYSTQELYIIIIKDPYTWIKSLCKASYYVIFGRPSWKRNPLCPQNISYFNGTMSANQWHGHLFNNLVELYNIYYGSWLGGNLTVGIGTKSRDENLSKLGKFNSYPKKKFYLGLQKFIRTFIYDENFRAKTETNELFQHLQTFYTPVTLPHIVIRFEDILFRPEDVVDKVCECVGGYRTEETWLQENAAKKHGKSKTRQQALAAYANETYRYINYDKTDIQFVNSVLNHSIMQMFGYKIS